MDGESQEQLVSKIQYKDFEPGEFTDRQERTCAQTITLIEQFPWDTERDHLVVSLTNPSVTIEGPGGDYLKLALYFEGKFVLHYFNSKHHLYTRSLPRFQDAYPYIQSFFETAHFQPDGLRLETTWLQKNSIHFQDGNFNYVMKPLKILPWAVGITIYCFFFIFACLEGAFTLPGPVKILFLLIPSALLFLCIGISLLFLNHYRSAKDKVLILSKGKDLFFYGSKDSPTPWHKKDILDVVTYGRRGRGGYPMLTRIAINFKDGQSIDISCLILRQEILVAKFPHCSQQLEKISFASIPPSAAIPS